MTWVDDQCSWCREDATRHTFCNVERTLLCSPCGHEGCGGE